MLSPVSPDRHNNELQLLMSLTQHTKLWKTMTSPSMNRRVLVFVVILLVFKKLLYTDLFDFLLASVLASTFLCNFFSPELSYPYMNLPIPVPNH